MEPKWRNPAYGELNRLAEALANFMYLIEHDSNDPEMVRYYVTFAERCLDRLRIVVHEADGELFPELSAGTISATGLRVVKPNGSG